VKVFIFNIEHYLPYEEESQNYLARLPILKCGLSIEHRDHVHQRDLRAKGRTIAEDIAVQAVADFAPDVVVYFQAWKDEDLSAAAFARIREMGIPIIAHVWDANVFPRWNEILLFEAVDCLVLMSLDAYVRWRVLARMFDDNKIAVFGHGMYDVPAAQKASYVKIYDATLMGSIEGTRADLVPLLAQRLSQRGYKFLHAGGVIGSSNPWLTWQQYDEIIRQSKLCISSQTVSNRLGIKGKIFEAMARGTLCFVDDIPEHRRFFPPDVVVFYEGMEDCAERILHYLDNDNERQEMERAASDWFNATFNYQDFYRRLLEYVAHGKGSPPYFPHVEKMFETVWAQRYELSPVMADAVTSMIRHVDVRGLIPLPAPFKAG
jgi:hypothetical protein